MTRLQRDTQAPSGSPGRWDGYDMPCMRWCIVRSVRQGTSRKEGRNYYICSSRLGLIRWDVIQHVKAVHDKMSNTSDVHLPHELLHCASNIGKQGRILGPQSLQSRALKDHVAFVPNSMLVTVLKQALVTRDACAAAHNNR